MRLQQHSHHERDGDSPITASIIRVTLREAFTTSKISFEMESDDAWLQVTLSLVACSTLSFFSNTAVTSRIPWTYSLMFSS